MSDRKTQDGSYRYRWGAHVESVEVDGDWLIMDPEQLTMTKLEDVSAYIWARLQVPRTVSDLVDDILQEYAINRDIVEGDVHNLLNNLRSLRLLEQDTLAD